MKRVPCPSRSTDLKLDLHPLRLIRWWPASKLGSIQQWLVNFMEENHDELPPDFYLEAVAHSSILDNQYLSIEDLDEIHRIISFKLKEEFNE